MGYESSGNGEFTWRGKESDRDIGEHLYLSGFEIVNQGEEGMTISFSGFHLYECMEDFRPILDNLNGTFEIEGDKQGDIWKLIFKDGEVLISKGYIEFVEPVKTQLIELWATKGENGEQPKKKIVLTMEGGVINNIEGIPPNHVVEVKDYDCDSYEKDQLTKDEKGDDVHISTWGA